MINIVLKLVVRCLFIFLVIPGFLLSTLGCARKELIADKYPESFYRVPKLLPDGPIDKKPMFIVCGDSQPGWRLEQKFIRRENWLAWKMILFPFYELYWLGNGFVGGVNYLRRVPDYNTKERLMVRDAIYGQANRSGADFILHVGDIPDDGRRASQWVTFLKEYKEDLPLLLDFPFLPVAGNHDRTNDLPHGLPNYEAIFGYPRFYVLDFPNLAIFAIDSNMILDQYQLIDDDRQDELFHEWFVSEGDSDQLAWLEKELAARNQRFKIIAMHHPPVSFGKHHGDWTNTKWGRNLPQKRQQLFKLFRNQGVNAVISGHEHIYEHSIVRYSAHESGCKGEVHIIVSSGGAPTRRTVGATKVAEFRKNYRTEGLDVVLQKQEAVYHYCVVDTTSDKIVIQVMEVTGDSEQPIRLIDEIFIEN